ncbi:MAG TPA: hypothetical protein PKD79_02700 [Candidatus Doudnabacteria bacterium]|nr:hypothetical protein [Candidatus Doudnabacteria bacterium]
MSESGIRDWTAVQSEFEGLEEHHWLVQEIFVHWEQNTEFKFWARFKHLFIGVTFSDFAIFIAYASLAFASGVAAFVSFTNNDLKISIFFTFFTIIFGAIAGCYATFSSKIPWLGIIKFIDDYWQHLLEFYSKSELEAKKQSFLSDKQFCFAQTARFLSEVYKPRLQKELDLLQAKLSTEVHTKKDRLDSDLTIVTSGLNNESLSSSQMAELEETKQQILQELQNLTLGEQSSEVSFKLFQTKQVLEAVSQTATKFQLASNAEADYQQTYGHIVERYQSSHLSYQSVNAGKYDFTEICAELDEIIAKGSLVEELGHQLFDSSHQIETTPVHKMIEERI